MISMTALQILRDVWPAFQTSIPGVVAALMSVLFMRGNSSKAELGKLTGKKFEEIADDLLSKGHISYVERAKLGNTLKIAKLAEKYYAQNEADDKARDNTGSEFDFDWFVRFFEAAGNIPQKTVFRRRKNLPSYDYVKDFWAEFFSEISTTAITPKEPLFVRSLCLDKEYRDVDVELQIKVGGASETQKHSPSITTPAVHAVTVTFRGGLQRG